MDVYVLLDVLLLILIALFIPIGFWRGAYREAFVTLGILFGASLGAFWGETWGIELSEITRLHESGGAFMIAMLCLISSTFLLGYSAGAAVPVPPPGWIARSLGALIAGTNGALLLSFALRDIRFYLLSAQDTGFLDNAVIAPFLSEGTGWILLVAGAVFVPIALVIALFGADIEFDDYYETGEYDTYDDADYADYNRRTVPVEQQAAAFTMAGARSSHRPAEETRPIPVVDENGPQPRNEPYSDSTTRSVEESTDEQQVAFGHKPPNGDTDEHQFDSAGAVEHDRCAHCRADISEADGFCPSCGRVI